MSVSSALRAHLCSSVACSAIATVRRDQYFGLLLRSTRSALAAPDVGGETDYIEGLLWTAGIVVTLLLRHGKQLIGAVSATTGSAS